MPDTLVETLFRALSKMNRFRGLFPRNFCFRPFLRSFGTDLASFPSVERLSTCLAVSRCSQADAELVVKVAEPRISFHGRALPKNLTSLESAEGQKLFAEAFSSQNARNFFPLITNFASQSDVAMCGPASLAMVLNALRLDPQRTWKAPWRWWSDEMLACCEGSLQAMKQTGVTLQFFDRIAQSQPGIKVITRGPDSLVDFKTSLFAAVSQLDTHIIVSFSREGLGQTGIGHFSPVAAVHLEKGLALVLDVARFKYPPYWVRIEELFEAMKQIDPVTQLPRGYSLIRRAIENE